MDQKIVIRSIKVWYVTSAFLIFVLVIISNMSIPSNINYKNDRLCDIDNDPASYVLYERNGNIIGEFCFLHAIMYNIKSSDWISKTMIYDTPVEIEFFSFGLPMIFAGIITLLYLEKVDLFLRKFQETGIGGLILIISSVFLFYIIIMRILSL